MSLLEELTNYLIADIENNERNRQLQQQKLEAQRREQEKVLRLALERARLTLRKYRLLIEDSKNYLDDWDVRDQERHFAFLARRLSDRQREPSILTQTAEYLIAKLQEKIARATRIREEAERKARKEQEQERWRQFVMMAACLPEGCDFRVFLDLYRKKTSTHQMGY